MKIVHLIYDHPRNPWLGGGGAKRAVEIGRRLAARGDEVRVICGGFPGRSDAEWEEDGILFRSCPAGSCYAASRLNYCRFAAKRLGELAAAGKCDIAVDDTSAFSVVAPWRVWKGPLVGIVHNRIGKRLFRKMGPLGLPFWLWETWMLKRHPATIAVSSWLSAQLKNLGAENVHVVRNGVDELAFRTDETPIEGRIAFLGRIDRFQKGLDLLLDAYELIRKEMPEASLQIVGDGRDLDGLRRDAERRGLPVEFSGWMGDARFAAISRASAIVAPSRFEGFPLVAVEAAAVARPIVMTRVDGLAEAMLDGETGISVDRDPRDIARAALRILRDGKLRETMGRAAREFAKRFDWDSIAAEQRDIYEREIARFGRSDRA